MIRSNALIKPMKGASIRLIKTPLTQRARVRAFCPFSSTSSSSDKSKTEGGDTVTVNPSPNQNSKAPSLPFRPRRRAPKSLLTPPPPKSTYFTNPPDRPIVPVTVFNDHPHDEPSPSRAPSSLLYLRKTQQNLLDHDESSRLAAHNLAPSAESLLRYADLFSSAVGSTEDNILTRRALNLSNISPTEGRRALREVDDLIEEEQKYTWIEDDQGFDRPTPAELGIEPEYPEVEAAVQREKDRWSNSAAGAGEEEEEMGDDFDPNQRAYGPWSESVVSVDRVQKVMRGGTTVRYRALAVGGNLNGCGGYGIAKAHSPPEAVAAACRKTRRNIFFVDRYKNAGITGDLVGKHNSCRVIIRATGVDAGLKGNPLGCEILKYFGITDCTIKTHGNRNDYNVVYGMFKALMMHESLEDIAMKRGKRLLNVERAKRLQI